MKIFFAILSSMLISLTVSAETAVCALTQEKSGGGSTKLLDFEVKQIKFTGDNVLGNTRYFQSFDSEEIALDGVNNEQNDAPYLPKGPFTVKMAGQFSTNLDTNITTLRLNIMQVWKGISYYSSPLASISLTAARGKFSFSADGIKKKDPMANSDSVTAYCEITAN